MNPFQKRGPACSNDSLFNGWLSATHALIAKAQIGTGLHPLGQPVAAPIGDPANGVRLMHSGRTRHGHLAPGG
jgi:hypothetical protein